MIETTNPSPDMLLTQAFNILRGRLEALPSLIHNHDLEGFAPMTKLTASAYGRYRSIRQSIEESVEATARDKAPTNYCDSCIDDSLHKVFEAIGSFHPFPAKAFVGPLLDGGLPITSGLYGKSLAAVLTERTNGLETLQYLHGAGFDLVAESARHDLVHRAVSRAHYPEIVTTAKWLVSIGCDINAPSCKDSHTPLQSTIKQELTASRKVAIDLMLDLGADINAVGARRGAAASPPLMIALQNGSLDTAHHLLARGALVSLGGKPLIRPDKLAGEARTLATAWLARSQANDALQQASVVAP